MQDGDIFRWRYKSPVGREPYWCKSCIALVQDGRFADTYWTSGNGSSWTEKDALELLDLEYLGNFSNLEKVSEYESKFYKRENIVDLRHSNNRSQENIFKRVGSQRDQVVMLELAEYMLVREREKIRSAEYDCKRLIENIEKLKAGDISIHL